MNMVFQIFQASQTFVFIFALVVGINTLGDFNKRFDRLERNLELHTAAMERRLDLNSENLSRVIGILHSPVLCSAPQSLNIRTGSHDVLIKQ